MINILMLQLREKARFVFLIFLTIFIFSSRAECTQSHTFVSPKGKYKIIFTELEHRKFSCEEQKESIDNVEHVVYRIDFFNAENNVLVKTVTYTDVYGWDKNCGAILDDAHDSDKNSGAISQNYILNYMLWSPKEDFVVLPVEGWASAPGTDRRTVIALNSKLLWKDSDFVFDKFVWVDDFIGIGDMHEDCHYEVSFFDGKQGITVPIKEANSPIGYELISYKGTKALIKKVLDNCAEKYEPPVCFLFDVVKKKEERISCPVDKTDSGKNPRNGDAGTVLKKATKKQ